MSFRFVMLANALSGNRKSTETESQNMQIKCYPIQLNLTSGDGHEMSGLDKLLTVIALRNSSSHVRVSFACSRLSVVGDERKRARKKRGRTNLPHFFSRSPFFAPPNYREPGTGYRSCCVRSHR